MGRHVSAVRLPRRHESGDQVYDDYDRYLATCVRAFDKHWSGDVQMKLRRI